MNRGRVGLAVNHFWRRMPIRPFDHASNALRAGPCETLAADANTIPQSAARTENQVKVCMGRIDNDGAGRFGRLIIYKLTLELWRERLCIPLRLIFWRERAIVGVGLGRPEYLPVRNCCVWPRQRWLPINLDVLCCSVTD
jgi:hypothetical protein